MKKGNIGNSVIVAAVAAGILGTAGGARAGDLDPAAVRQAALDAGLAPLSSVAVPAPNLNQFLNPGGTSAAIKLGKALFWDMQVGSDGQACASCHFHAFADNRARNQLNPGTRNANPALQGVFAPTASGGAGGPNYELVLEDFPLHLLADPEEENFLARIVLFDTDDVVSSQGVNRARFYIFPYAGFPGSLPLSDPVFQVAGTNTRRVEPRNTPTVVNAVFNSANFWDGRAHNVFNGATVFGPLDTEAHAWVRAPGWSGMSMGLTVRIPDSSLASQAVGPPTNDFEMSFFDRPFKDVGRKLLGSTPLGLQRVHPQDSVLGALSLAHVNADGSLGGHFGLRTTYQALIQQAFRKEFWNARGIRGYSQMEMNFPLFLGLSIQLYETTLVSDDSPFDQFMAGDDAALDDEQLKGLLTFIRTPASRDPIFTDDIGVGNCVSCHSGPELTAAAFTSLQGRPIGVRSMPDLVDGFLEPGAQTAYVDAGFANIGVRRSGDDLGRGGSELGKPLSFARQAIAHIPGAPALPGCAGDCPQANRVAVDGAFKIPGLRNVELTGPYFHNGGQATLEQVIEFYDRQSDFGDVNLANLDQNIALIELSDTDEDPLVSFLLALTDDRVRDELAPFDHPEIFVADGHPGDTESVECSRLGRACDEQVRIPGVGRFGRPAANLPPLEPFLGGGGGDGR